MQKTAYKLVKIFKIKKPRIPGVTLIIDDDEKYQQMLKLLLQDCCSKTVIALNAEEGFKYLEKCASRVTLILLDVNLPGISGVEFLYKIKQINLLKNIPIILQTGCEYSDIQKGLGLGASLYLRKPYLKEELYSAINHIKLENNKKD